MKAIAGPGDILKKGTPAIVKGNEEALLLAITMSDYGAKGPLPQSLLKGNYVGSNLTQDSEVRKFVFTNVGDKSLFKTFESSTSIAANQCWLECETTQASEIVLYFESTTGIQDIQASTRCKNIYYIDGKCMKTPQKGINIVDNKKMFIK